MDCNKAQSQLGAWQDGELNALTVGRLRRHVRYCQQCAAEANELKRLTKTLRDAAPFGPEISRPSAPPFFALRRIAPPLFAVGLVVLSWAVFTVQRENRLASVASCVPVSGRPPPSVAPRPVIAVIQSANQSPQQAAKPLVVRKAYIIVAQSPRNAPRRVSRRSSEVTRRRRVTSEERPKVTVAATRKITFAAAPLPSPPETKREEIIVIAARDWTSEEVRQKWEAATDALHEQWEDAAKDAARRLRPETKGTNTL